MEKKIFGTSIKFKILLLFPLGLIVFVFLMNVLSDTTEKINILIIAVLIAYVIFYISRINRKMIVDLEWITVNGNGFTRHKIYYDELRYIDLKKSWTGRVYMVVGYMAGRTRKRVSFATEILSAIQLSEFSKIVTKYGRSLSRNNLHRIDMMHHSNKYKKKNHFLHDVFDVVMDFILGSLGM